VPGNHDAYVAQGAEFFRQCFADYSTSDADWRWPDGSEWPIVRVRGPVAIIGLSTSQQTPWFTAYGLLGEGQRERLRTALADPRLAGLFRVVALHHPPAGPASTSRVRGLRDRAELAAVLGETGAELVLHGHEHRDVVSALSGPRGRAIPVRGIPSASYEAGDATRRARYRIYEVASPSPGQRPIVVSERVRIWDPEAGCVVGAPEVAASPGSSPQKANDYDNLTPDPRIGYDATKGAS
jgi:3',5'-cyclic AMP phosphodiesterase CpdA